MVDQADKLLIGAHTSAAGGVSNALYEGAEIGATTIQLFTSNQKQWAGKPIGDEEVERWFAALEETGIKEVMSHDSYLINLGSFDEDVLKKSQKAFKEELERCHQLDITYLNFHPGAALKGDPDECIDQIAKSLIHMENLAERGKTRLLLEATAGQGSSIGWRFEQLAAIIDKVQGHVPIGVCIDTCHIFAAGYDIRTSEGWDHVLKEFDKVIGLKHLFAFHVNDSKKGLGTRVDRHADLGDGEIGIESFKVLINHQKTKKLPKYLETPGGPPVWTKEIAMLRGFYAHKN